MAENDFLTDLALAGDLVAEHFEDWPDWLKTEFDEHANDGHVGSRLLSQNARVRVWEIRLAPGQRWHAHRHVLDYFWTAVTPGRSRQHTSDGTTREVPWEMRVSGLRGRVGGATLRLGDHPYAKELASLGLPKRAMVSGSVAHVAMTFGDAQVLG